MSVQNFIPQLWSTRINTVLLKSLVYGNVANTDWEGEIREVGDAVRINSVGPVTIGNYVRNSTVITPEQVENDQLLLTIDQAKYFAFQVDDLDRAQANVNFISTAMERAAWGLRNEADKYIAALWSQASSVTAATAVNSVNVLAALLTLGQKLTELNVPMDGRWAVIPPWMHTKLVLAKVIVEAKIEDAAFVEGFVGRAAGFDLYVSNNVPIVTTAGVDQYKVMGGTSKSITFAAQIDKVEAYRPHQSFSDAVKGLYLFGAKMVYPDACAVLDASYSAEP
jgi:hypothetical protein